MSLSQAQGLLPGSGAFPGKPIAWVSVLGLHHLGRQVIFLGQWFVP